MSSSMFIESSSLPGDSVDYASTSDSNLVVVYGKNGISFDDKGLENLIEEKQISSISVIRLTSPTSSMEEEEEEEAKLEEMFRRQDIQSAESSDDEEKTSRDSASDKPDDDNDACDDDSSECRGKQEDEQSVEGSDDEATEDAESRNKKLSRQRVLQSNISKLKRTSRKRKRVRPEIVGLRLEEFYPPEDANEIIKEALKMAGLGPDRKSKEDIEFQLFVIKNDHCYTPFTSPSQMKAKLAADKLEIEKQANSRKVLGVYQTTGGGGKQIFVRKKFFQKQEEPITKATSTSTSSFVNDKSITPTASRNKKDNRDVKPQVEADCTEDDDNARSSNDEGDTTKAGEEDEDSECGLTEEESDESDNDRDSDLDFDVNNPKGRRRKVKVAKFIKRHSIGVPKLQQKTKRFHSQEEPAEIIKKPPTFTIVNRQKSLVKISSDVGRITVRPVPTKIVHVGGSVGTGLVGSCGQIKVLSPIVAALPPIPRITYENKCSITSSLLSPASTTISNIPHKPLMLKGSTAVNTSSPSHREILINKQIMSSPKTKGFTDLSTLMEQNEKEKPSVFVEAQKAPHIADVAAPVVAQKAATPQNKGFMPIGLETAATNQLPAQISIQTHQSSSELEAEHDKQLDLINSIVQDELKKSNEVVSPATNINENIPELVKMLESTEKVLEKTNISKKEDCNVSNISDSRVCGNANIYGNEVTQSNESTITDIDINNASLLATHDDDDDLPDDILQLVDMMQDDKTLQEAVKVLGAGDCNDSISNISSNNTNQKPPPLTPIMQQHPAAKINILEDIPHSSKSIIQMRISNLPVQSITPRSTITMSRPTPSKSSPLVRSEPIQIVRGNGRVITLPPIEAPTTRAKRRAQVQPHSIIQNTVMTPASSSAVPININESSLDNSLHSNSSLASVGSVAQEKKSQDNSNRRRGSKENVTASGSVGNQKAKGRNTASKKVRRKPQSAVDATESANEDDDDPNKLWCICRQPHNNRFMICCDACEDWFHGTCVNITKAMGLEMEQKGIDWTCPKCVRKQEEKKQPKITDLLVKKPVETTAQLSADYYPTMPTASIAAIQPVVSDAIVTAINIQRPNISKIQAKEITKTVIDTNKSRLQPGQFINLKDLSSGGKKVIIQAATNSSSGQKKLFVTTQSLRTSATLTTPIRAIAVVKHIPGHGNQIHQHQSIKVIRTISPAKSPAQNFITPSASGSTSKAINSKDSSTLCIVCKKPARVNSIYCSDDCIRKHAQNALHIFMTKTQSEVDAPLASNAPDEKVKKKQKGLFEDLLSMADRKPKVERVNVYERKSGRVLTGSSAPTISNLKKWLQENPTFEVVQPGSLQALDIEKKQKQRTQYSSSPTVSQKAATSPPPLKLLPQSSPVQQKADVSRSNSPQTPAPLTLLKQTLTPQLKSNKSVVDFVKSSSPSTISRPGTPKQLQKYPQNVSIKADKTPKPSEDVKSAKDKSNSIKKQANTESCSNKSTNSDGEPIRLLVRRTLKEQLLLRAQDEDSSASTVSSTDNANISEFPKLTPEEIEEFANATELEMYNYFSRDAGIKYKAKYRSLIFNIKDRKNHTLFAKICRKQIEPKQLVRMTPDEMASQELAQWREQENKHQLEMIKKSELDLLSCAKNYVLKTHKGEEVIESKSAEYENVDISIPVEDVVAALNKTDFSQETSTTTRSQNHWSDVDTTLLSLSNVAELQQLSVEDKLKTSKDKDKERDKEKDRHRDRDRNRDGREREKRHKSKDPHRDKSHSRKRSRSHSRSRSRERSEKRHKSSHKDEKRDRDKDRVKDRSERDQHGDSRANDKKIEKKTANISKTREISSVKRHQHHDQYANPLETYNLIDQILESTKTVEEAANLVLDRDKDFEIVRRTSGTPLPSQSISSTTSKGSMDAGCVIDIHTPPTYVESDQEPTSTVSIPTPPHDPYARFMSTNSPTFEDGETNRCNATTLWTGDINMVDVASFQLSVQPVLGNSIGLEKLLAKELDVVGRIGPETVWDYISKIKKSPNKEIVIIRLIPASESETSAYKILYEYLDNRNRLGVVKSVSPYIKDFYIYPLGAGKEMPTVLRRSEPVEFYDDPCRPDILIGIIIRVVGKRQNLVGQPNTVVTANNTIAGSSKFASRTSEVDSSQSPPGSPKMKKRRQSIAPKDIDVDAIIKAPIVSKSQKGITSNVSTVIALTDADEPYSPGGSSDDDLPLLPVKLPASSNQMQTAEDELKRKMEEINRQIAAQEMEIAGLLTGESSKFGSNSSKTSKVLANIAIPSNLSQILASIKPTMVSQESLPAVPPPPPLIGSLTKTPTSSTSIAVNEVYNPALCIGSPYEAKSTTTSSSRLANLSEAELLSMVPDDITIAPKPPPAARYEEPPPPGV